MYYEDDLIDEISATMVARMLVEHVSLLKSSG